ncbi:MAG: hypothetical protein DSM106950_08445 [Stigonema ocellatum SAG 48.90 = DSM 106950]|nr:hypothetical protein [Stigonema ocellatum SAG 48.90 = DSM 106950]
MKVIAYLLYGNKREYELELLFSIISALRLLKDNSEELIISVISDRQDVVPELPIDRIIFSQNEFAEWTNNGTYNHRAKICALIKALDHYQAPVILIDTDTYFIDNPAKLFDRVSPQRSVMHAFEDTINDQLYTWQPIIEKLGDGMNRSEFYVSPQSPMFNSGVIGVDLANRWLLEKSLTFVDELYSLSPVFNIEQFALGTVLNKYNDLSLSTDIVEHYWSHERAFIHVQIRRAFKDLTATNLEIYLTDSSPLEIGYPATHWKDKLVSRLLARLKHWNSNYKFAYLAYRSALSCASKDSDYANAWAKVALQILKDLVFMDEKKSFACLPNVQRDFRQFRKDSLKTLAWLDSNLKSSWIEFWEQCS